MGAHTLLRLVLEAPERAAGVVVITPAYDPAELDDPERLARVHRCPGPACGWLFLDTSGRRRWCSMSTCGSRVKMRRLYARQRQADRRQ